MMKTCELPECGVEFEPNQPQQRYCSRKHSHRDYYINHREYVRELHQRYYEMHKEEHSVRNRNNYLANREQRLKYMQSYAHTELGYAKLRAVNSRNGAARRMAVVDPEFTDFVLSEILLNTLVCAHCRITLDLRARIIDHKIAVINGGSHCESNIQILCAECHKIKTILDSRQAWDVRANLYEGTS